MKIVIVGGGTAGWLAALMISKIRREHSVTVIESSKIGIIGAGEGSTGTLTNIVQNEMHDLGCNEQDFIKECDATIKLGIKHIGWNEDPNKFYYGPIDGSPTSYDSSDIAFLHALGYRDENLLHIITELGYKIHHNKNSFVEERGDHAYHFDAHKVGQYFKKICDTVAHIDSEVDEVMLDSMTGYIKALRLSNGTVESGDMFIDASGFNQVLMKAVGGHWLSYKNNLPVNSALPFLLPYEEDEKIEPVTNAWAQRNGWCWQIPTLNRRGCGYVFCDDFTTPEQAQDELEQTIGKKVDPIRLLKFESGRQQELWIKNCLSVGLCAAFAEPLEATSIHTTIVQLKSFVYGCIGRDVEQTCNKAQIAQYNNTMGHLYDTLKDFLVAHYTCGRKDTPFWQFIDSGDTMTPFVKDMHNMCKYRVPNQSMFNRQEGSAGWPLWSYVLAGTGKLSDYVCRKELDYNNDTFIADASYKQHIEQHDQKSINLPDNTQVIRNMQ